MWYKSSKGNKSRWYDSAWGETSLDVIIREDFLEEVALSWDLNDKTVVLHKAKQSGKR